MPVAILLVLLVLLTGLGWLARARRLRAGRFARLNDLLVQVNAGDDRFLEDTIDGLPVPARIYLRHALAADRPLPRSADVRMSGSLRVGAEDWVPFEARQRICAERGFIWEAQIAALGPLEVEGADWLFGEDAGVEYTLGGWWPILERRDQDVARSALGRLMVELIWLPSALTPQRGARWMRGDTDRAVVTPAGSTTPMTLVVSDDGRLREASVVRRRVEANGETSIAPFGVSVEAEKCFGEFHVPSRLVVAWGIGTDDRQDFMRVAVDEISWL
jgi:hypothetical protein